jgi:hypothetical protein
MGHPSALVKLSGDLLAMLKERIRILISGPHAIIFRVIGHETSTPAMIANLRSGLIVAAPV